MKTRTAKNFSSLRSLRLCGECCLALCVIVMCGSCTEKIINYKPFFTGIEGAKTQTPATSDGSGKVVLPKAGKNDQIGLIKTNDDGSVTLLSKTGRDLMIHMQRTLTDGEKEQFTEQLLSELTVAEYHEHGIDPGQAFETLRKSRKDIVKLFNRMPLGEHSPNVFMDPIGRNMFRVRVTGAAKKGLDKWTGFDMVLEKGNWKLRWFVE